GSRQIHECEKESAVRAAPPEMWFSMQFRSRPSWGCCLSRPEGAAHKGDRTLCAQHPPGGPRKGAWPCFIENPVLALKGRGGIARVKPLGSGRTNRPPSPEGAGSGDRKLPRSRPFGANTKNAPPSQGLHPWLSQHAPSGIKPGFTTEPPGPFFPDALTAGTSR